MQYRNTGKPVRWNARAFHVSNLFCMTKTRAMTIVLIIVTVVVVLVIWNRFGSIKNISKCDLVVDYLNHVTCPSAKSSCKTIFANKMGLVGTNPVQQPNSRKCSTDPKYWFISGFVVWKRNTASLRDPQVKTQQQALLLTVYPEIESY